MTDPQTRSDHGDPRVAALLTEANHLGWPVHFRTDITRHDAMALSGMPAREPFAWAIGTWGTHMARVGGQVTMRGVASAFGEDCCRFYVWDGARLSPVVADAGQRAVRADEALAVIAGRRYEVRPRRVCSLVPHWLGTRSDADQLAQSWSKRFGEEFHVIDTWKGA